MNGSTAGQQEAEVSPGAIERVYLDTVGEAHWAGESFVAYWRRLRDSIFRDTERALAAASTNPNPEDRATIENTVEHVRGDLQNINGAMGLIEETLYVVKDALLDCAGVGYPRRPPGPVEDRSQRAPE